MMIFNMAWRNIWRNKMRSMIIMLSITVGLLAGIAVLSLYKGMLKSRIRNVVDAEVGHLQIHDTAFKKDYDPKYVLAKGNDLLVAVRKVPRVKLATPRSITNAMLATTNGSAGVQVNGVVPALEYEASKLKQKIVEGSLFDSTRRNEVMIGKKLASKMKLKPGSKLVLTFTDTSGNIVSGAFRIAAIYRSSNTPLDERNVYVPISDLNNLLGIRHSFHEISVLLENDGDLTNVSHQLHSLFPFYLVESWKEISPETVLLVNTTNQYSYIIMVIIMFALAFGIINTMLMAVLERTREFGMMLALGMARRKIFLLAMVETIILTLAGTPIGLLGGWLASGYFHVHGLDLSGMGREMMNSFGFETIVYPEFPEDKLPGVMAIVAGTAIVSGLFPAMKVVKLDIMEALKR
jgi:putative ABC transport system permease protein